MNLNVKIEGLGFPLLCLHGHPGNSQCLSVFTNKLSQRLKTFAPDLRGYGKSRVSENFEMSDHLTDLEALLDFYQIDRCLLLGWSLGGILAIELALRNPNRFSGLILVATAARPRSSHPKTTWQDLLFTGIAATINYFNPGGKWNIETFGKRSLFRYLIQQHSPVAYQYIGSCLLSAYFQTSNAAKKALSNSLKMGYDRTEDLSKLAHIPCLVLAGDEDRHITAQSSLETARQLKNSDWHCYDNTAHLFPWEISDRVLEDINSWLDDRPQIWG